MQFISYLKGGQEQLALVIDGKVLDSGKVHPALPNKMKTFLKDWDKAFPLARQGIQQVAFTNMTAPPVEQVKLLSPVPHPSSCRDAYAFRQHVETARRNRGAKMIAEFDQFPVFYFTNHNAVYGPGEITCMPDHFQKLDFELEVAVVICRSGRNIRAQDADEYIGGFMIMNDLSARQLQSEEMKLNLGPAKGKDFATAFGPSLVTRDELEKYKISPKEGHTGNAYDMEMICRVNGIQVSAGNMKEMDWTFAEIIERCSYGVELKPGDIIGSGTVGTGCFLELNGTNKRNNEHYEEQWLQAGDVVEMEVTGLGLLKNIIIAEATDYSILNLKKN